MKNWDAECQYARRKEIFQLYRRYMADSIDDNGIWHGKEEEMGTREKIWHCFTLFDGNAKEIERANRILDLTPLIKCHFGPMSCMLTLLNFESLLSEKVRNKLEDYVRSSLVSQADSRVRFTMYNDNFASMATFTLLTAGERFGDKDAFEAGKEKLNQLKELYMRCGAIMEYCSPTYTPLTIHCMAEIYNYVKDPKIRELALKCEERGWAEAATHYHAPSGRLAGPYARAYAVDMAGHPHATHFLLYLVFGKDIFINPVKDMFPPRWGQIIHHGLERLMWPNLVWLCINPCHCPDDLAEILLDKKYPFTVINKTECLPSLVNGYKADAETGEKVFIDNTMEFPATSGPIYTYMTRDYALGTAHSQFHDGGLSESFYITYRKKVPVSDLADTGVVFSRYIINEREPETMNHYSVYGDCHGDIGFRDEGRKFGMQHKDCSLVAYKPKHFEAHSISSLKLSIIFPCHFSGIEEVRLGDEKLTDFKGESEKPCTVFVKDGPVYMAFTPLSLTDHGRSATVKVQKTDRYIMISFYNYEGPARAFNIKDLFLTTNGFIANVKTQDEIPDIHGFMQHVYEHSLTDITTESEKAYTRWIRYKSAKDIDLQFAFSPVSEGMLMATVNGRPRPEPVFRATGLDSFRLPFLEE